MAAALQADELGDIFQVLAENELITAGQTGTVRTPSLSNRPSAAGSFKI